MSSGDCSVTKRMLAGTLLFHSLEERLEMISVIKELLDAQLTRTQTNLNVMKCSNCGNSDFIKYGKTARGTQRWQCTGCKTVRCFKNTNGTVTNTRLSYDQWMLYAECFVDQLTISETCKKIGVCPKTVKYMRTRTLEVLKSDLLST